MIVSGAMQIEDLREKLRQIPNDDDPSLHRAHALVAASFLDDALGELLGAHLVSCAAKLVRGRLKEFGIRIDVCEALGVISRDFAADLHVIREVRNAFAHGHAELYFTTPAIETLCRRLRNIAIIGFDPREAYLDTSKTIATALLEIAALRRGSAPDVPLSGGWQVCEGHTRLARDLNRTFNTPRTGPPKSLLELVEEMQQRQGRGSSE